jgi:16S rRNA processing protein RimM
MTKPPSRDDQLIIGKFGATYGVYGWVKVHSYTQPIDAILSYLPWAVASSDSWQPLTVKQGKIHNNVVVVKIQDYNDIDTAQVLTGRFISVPRHYLPELPDDQYYWADLEGLTVINLEGINLGYIDYLFEVQGNTIVVIKGKKEHLIPWLRPQVIKQVSLENQEILVDWDPEF